MSRCHMTLLCTLHAEKIQTLVKVLNFTSRCGRGTKPSDYLHPSASAKLRSGGKGFVHQPQLRQRGGSVFG